MAAGHKNQGKSRHVKNRGQGKKRKKDAPDASKTEDVAGMRVGYHSEHSDKDSLTEEKAEEENDTSDHRG